MIPNLAIIVSAYAAARLINEYVIGRDSTQGRALVAVIGLVAVAIGLIGILSASSSLGDLGI